MKIESLNDILEELEAIRDSLKFCDNYTTGIDLDNLGNEIKLLIKQGYQLKKSQNKITNKDVINDLYSILFNYKVDTENLIKEEIERLIIKLGGDIE